MCNFIIKKKEKRKKKRQKFDYQYLTKARISLPNNFSRKRNPEKYERPTINNPPTTLPNHASLYNPLIAIFQFHRCIKKKKEKGKKARRENPPKLIYSPIENTENIPNIAAKMAGQKNSLLDIITLHRLLSTTDRFRRHDKEHETRYGRKEDPSPPPSNLRSSKIPKGHRGLSRITGPRGYLVVTR